MYKMYMYAGRKAEVDLRTEGPSPLSMAVQLSHNDRRNIDLILEGPSLGLTRLTNRCIHHKDNVVRILSWCESV